MTAVGARARHSDQIVQIKVYAPDNRNLNQDYIAKYLQEVITSPNTPKHKLTEFIGNDLKRKLQGTNALWVVVEVHNMENNAFTEETYVINENLDN